MMSEAEKARYRVLEDALHQMQLETLTDGEDPTDEQRALFVGSNLATLDALFAIRDGESWRGMTDPSEMAREILSKSGIGD